MKRFQKPTLAIFGTLVAGLCQAQTWGHDFTISGGAVISPQAMVEDSSGNIYVLGNTTSNNGDMAVLKISSGGSLTSSATIAVSTTQELGYDITIGPDGNLYILGSTGLNKLYITCMSTSLSTVWTNSSITATVPGGGNSYDVLPYRLVVNGSSGSPTVFATAQTEESTGAVATDIKDASSAKAVFYVKLDSSGSVVYSGTWDGVSGQPDNLYGTHAVSNGYVFVTDTKVHVGFQWLSRTYYEKVNSSGTVAWSVTPSITSILNRSHAISNSIVHEDSVYTGFGNIGVVSGHANNDMHEFHVGLDCSATSAPSSGAWWQSMYAWNGSSITQTNNNSGIGWWTPSGQSSQPVGIGWGDDVGLDDYYDKSWLRYDQSLIDSYYQHNPMTIDFPFRADNGFLTQRCFDAYAGRLAAWGRTKTSNSFRLLTAKATASPITVDTSDTITSGYSITKFTHVLASKQSDSAYALLDIVDGSGNHKAALYKYDR